jgi:hypothetical protein
MLGGAGMHKFLIEFLFMLSSQDFQVDTHVKVGNYITVLVVFVIPLLLIVAPVAELYFGKIIKLV